MGDRTSVTLTVLRCQAQKAQALFSDGYESDDDTSGEKLLYSWEFDDVNWGELPFLSELCAAGIAYDSEWGSGSDYSSGGAHCRFTPEGELVEKVLYDNEDSLPLHLLQKYLDEPAALRQRIVDKIEERTLLPLDAEQMVYGARYRMRQLIAS